VVDGLAAIILAAGYSSRMGECKALLPLGASTVLEQVIDLFHSCAIPEIIVVTGHQAEAVTAVAEKAGAMVVHNPDFAQGMFSSIVAGVRALSPERRAFFLLPVDIPLIRKGVITMLARAFQTTSPLLTYPVYDGHRGHPPLISAALVPSILHGDGSNGLRDILAEVEADEPGRVRDIAVADTNILFDMDTPEDYREGCLRFARKDVPTMAECTMLLHEIFALPDKGLAHGEQVAEVAVAICDLIAAKRTPPPDRELCRVCGWLHDLAKGRPNHEEEGGRLLAELGFDRAAAIVAAHRESEYAPGIPVSEKEIVFLADKMVSGRTRVSIEERFQQKLNIYRDDPAACAAIQRRLLQAQTVLTAIEKEIGGSLSRLLACHKGAT
jgi:molybdenum cofactor cytidylyltransferase